MYQKILEDVEKNHLFDKHKKVLIAVSGGVDSMNLLHFLHFYQEKLGIEIAIAHVNHKQRKESEEEEVYLRKWSKEHDIPIFISHFKGEFSENKAREFRYRFFSDVMCQHHFTALVTAHHKDDQVETIFMRLIRGSLFRYFSSIKRISHFSDGELIRPFLPFSKNELPAVFHFEDRTNFETNYLRNRIRNNYLPQLRKENPRLDNHLLQLAEESRLYQNALKELTKYIDITKTIEFEQQISSVQYFLLQDYLSHFNDIELTKNQFQEILRLLQTKKEVTYKINKDKSIIKNKQTIRIENFRPKTDSSLSEKVIKYEQTLLLGPYHFRFSSDLLELDYIPLYSKTPILLRGRKSGDKISFGNFSKKIRRLFIDDKVSIEDRQKAIIGEQEGDIIFILTEHKTYLRKPLESDTIKARLYVEKIEKG